MVRKENISQGNFPFPSWYVHVGKNTVCCLRDFATGFCKAVEILQVCVSAREQEAECVKADPTCLWSSCLHSMAEVAEPAWFPYLIYWAVWEEAVEGSWESVDVGEAWLSRNSCPALSSGALHRLLQGGCSRLLYMCICVCVWYFFPLLLFLLQQHWEMRPELNDVYSKLPDWSNSLLSSRLPTTDGFMQSTGL